MSGVTWNWLAARLAALIGVLALLLLPLFLAELPWPLVDSTYGEAAQPLELLGWAGSVLIACWVGAVVHRSRRAGIPHQELAFRLLPAAGWLVGLYWITEHHGKAWDYRCYEDAARALLAGRNPYASTTYLYPPLLMQLLLGAHRLVASAVDLLGVRHQPDQLWNIVFYLYQCAQLLLLAGALWLATRLADRLGLSAAHAAALVTLLFVLDSPLVRTLRHNQVNLLLLDVSLLALWAGDRRPVVCGLAVAVGAHIKLYSLLLLGPWAVTRRLAIVLAAAAGCAGILWIQTAGGTDWSPWTQFAEFFTGRIGAGLAPGDLQAKLRNNSVHGLVHNTAAVLGLPVAFARVAHVAAMVALLGWFLLRFAQRERLYRQELAQPPERRAANELDWLRFASAGVDAVTLALLISPLVWEHHFVLALPLAIFAAATAGRQRPLRVAAATAAMLAVPTFDLYPFSYCRIAGLVALVACLSPGCALRIDRAVHRPAGSRQNAEQVPGTGGTAAPPRLGE